MKPLPYPPPLSHLSRLYFELSKLGARCVGEKRGWPYHPRDSHDLLALAGEMSRFDPRLLGILVEYLSLYWRSLNPFLIRERYKNQATPQVWGVLSHFVKGLDLDPEATYFFDYLTSGLGKVSPQLYFREVYPIGSRLMAKAATESLKEYSDWGFLATERPTLYDTNRETCGRWSKASRLNILRRLLQQQASVSLNTYLRDLNYSISRQQALHDLAHCGFARLQGKGRGARWIYRNVIKKSLDGYLYDT